MLYFSETDSVVRVSDLTVNLLFSKYRELRRNKKNTFGFPKEKIFIFL